MWDHNHRAWIDWPNNEIFNISSYEAEIQFVHYKSSYDNYTHAVDDNQTDSLAIVAVFVEEVPKLSQQITPFPAAITDLMTKAGELISMENEELLEMDLTLDQLISNIEWEKISE